MQNDLFDVGADLCTPVTPDPEFPPLRITAAYTERLEAACDRYNEALPTLASFILPGGTPAAALLHQARTVVRRAERSVWALLAVDAERTNPETARYLNRLSDLLFILGRFANPGGDILWEPGAHSGAHAQRAAGRPRTPHRRTDRLSAGAPTPARRAARSPSSGPSRARGARRGRALHDDEVAGQGQVVAPDGCADR